MKYQLCSIVVTAAVAATLRELARRLDLEDQAGMFAVGLSATGATPATHFISSGCVPKPLVTAMRDPALMFTTAKAAYEANGAVFPFTQTQINNTLGGCTVVAGANDTEEPLPETPTATLTRLALKPIAVTLN